MFGSASGTIIRGDSRIVIYVTLLFMAVGIIIAAVKHEKTRLTQEYRAMASANVVILLLCVFLPYFAGNLNIPRTYHFVTLFLAPFCVLGGLAIFKRALSMVRHVNVHLSIGAIEKGSVILTTFLLITYFLFNTGFVYEVTGVAPSSISLSMERMKTSNATDTKIWLSSMVLSEQDVSSAIWLSQNRNDSFDVYSDLYSAYHALASYGLLRYNYVHMLLNDTKIGKTTYIYLSKLNIADGVVTGPDANSPPWNTSDLFPVLRDSNKIYSNGFSEVFLGASQTS